MIDPTTDPLINQNAPDFTASATGEQTVSLAGLRHRTVVLYFYPKDNTPGCTTEAQQFRDLYPEFQKVGNGSCLIFGISRDNLRSHENFRAKHNLPFDLIADPDEKLCALFSVIKDKKLYGRQVRGIERSTFVVDGAGVLRRAWRGVKVPGHAQEVLDFVSSLPAN